MKKTTDHKEIQTWCEKMGGKPALINYQEVKEDQTGIRINFPGNTDEKLLSDAHPSKDITWEEFFRTFDEQQFQFLYEEEAKGDDPTRWYRFERRNTM